MTEIFTDNANLRGLLESGQQLKISDVVHKTFIAVDENGTEAAAATGLHFFLNKLLFNSLSSSIFFLSLKCAMQFVDRVFALLNFVRIIRFCISFKIENQIPSFLAVASRNSNNATIKQTNTYLKILECTLL